MRRSIIIPNTDILPNSEEYSRDISKDESHAADVLKFSDMYNLGINFETLHVNSFCSELWYKSIATIGHAFVRIDESILVYLPEELSINQIDWFINHKNFLLKKK